MNENALYINLGQIPGGVKLVENYSSRFVSCIQQDCMQESMMILQGLAGVIGEINRNLIWNPLYRLFGCNIKSMKRYMWMLADTSDGSRLFDRAHGEYLDTFMIEGSFPIQPPFSFSVTTEPADSMNLSLTVHDNVFKYAKSENRGELDPASVTAASFAEVLYRELYFPALKLLAGEENTPAIRAFIGKSIEERFLPLA